MISPGVVDDNYIDGFAGLGAEFYALYQETHNRRSFFPGSEQIRIMHERMHAKLYAKEKGMLIEEGILTRCPARVWMILQIPYWKWEGSVRSRFRVMSFVPQTGSPMETVKKADPMLELKIIAIMRLMYPSSLIPASQDIDGIKGLEDRNNAGANVITSILPPLSGLMGVAQSSMDVDEGGRTVEEASVILRNMGLEPAAAEEYKNYLSGLRRGKKV